ncbi:COP23 domain-containing protein [Aetokthonos hydrillicola Thurmond2011]|jgi:hypothetical protein|uniref:COP23 domain-containing protein n=1 Tax=Aetokthonos hydrillicola Thurmond2011 TaxID=2712845 RepID=A0AAP5M7H3_9CYAN|nr:COP23 domain-containing protein [Aetokthonos hydrillicola]MBO3462057.1 hypothetical protein [Aetokthonos hydrillicola CCALA 1050]MBW4589336.1 COP23 domain-containing protein [Aetokthonos hydrillicola CCALA 1050]MDR9898131.1 COP23 domain-containing protein [Aetokthonos hydrillicola Thurmond2011]
MHNKQFKLTTWIVRGFIVTSVAAFTQPTMAATSVNVACKASTSTPKIIATVAKEGSKKDFTILNLLSEYVSPKNALQNCENTAKTLQSLYDSGNANYLTIDKLNAQPVVCAVERRGIGCDHTSAKVLFTLDPKANPTKALYDMLGSDFKQTQPPDTRTISRIYSDIRPRWSRWWPF